MNSPLPAYLRAAGSLAFAWGACDCCTWACAWVAQQRGVDPSAAWRGLYDDEHGAMTIILEGGGLLALADMAMSDAGLVATPDPLPGDVGVVVTDQGEALAIRTAIGWAAKAQGRGLVVAAWPVRGAWTV